MDSGTQRLIDAPGEMVITAPFIGMTQGLWQAPERYIHAYWSERPGLWSHGDLVTESAEGSFTVLGRADDTLKIAGKRVGPAEVEAAVLECDGVVEAAAVGLPDAVKGQRLVLLVRTIEASPGLQARVADRVEGALGKPFRPAAVHVVADLPRTRNGKLMRRLIRDLLAGLAPGDLSVLENPAAIELIRQLGAKPIPAAD
jgi:acetyl-CoA synthetase